MLADKDCHTECLASVPCRIHCACCYNAAYTIRCCIYAKVYGIKERMAGLSPMHPCNIIWNASGPYLQEAMQDVTGHKALTYPMHRHTCCIPVCIVSRQVMQRWPYHVTIPVARLRSELYIIQLAVKQFFQFRPVGLQVVDQHIVQKGGHGHPFLDHGQYAGQQGVGFTTDVSLLAVYGFVAVQKEFFIAFLHPQASGCVPFPFIRDGTECYLLY